MIMENQAISHSQFCYPRTTTLITCSESMLILHDFAIGGDNHMGNHRPPRSSMDQRSPSASTDACSTYSIIFETRTPPAAPISNFSHPTLLFRQVVPLMLALTSFEEKGTKYPVFNLAYIPNNRLFQAVMEKRYSIEDFEVLKADFMQLGYDEQLSECIQHTFVNDFSWTSGKTVTLVEAQQALFRVWRKFQSRSMVALKLEKGTYIPRHQQFSVVCDNKLYFAQSEANISQQKMFSNVEAKSIALGDPVSNLKDTVQTLSGISATVPFWSCRVHSRGRFGSFPLESNPSAEVQSVQFDLPISSGVAVL